MSMLSQHSFFPKIFKLPGWWSIWRLQWIRLVLCSRNLWHVWKRMWGSYQVKRSRKPKLMDTNQSVFTLDGDWGKFAFLRYRICSHTCFLKKIYGHVGRRTKRSYAMDCWIWSEISQLRDQQTRPRWCHRLSPNILIMIVNSHPYIPDTVTLNRLKHQMTRLGMLSRSWLTNVEQKESPISNLNQIDQNLLQSIYPARTHPCFFQSRRNRFKLHGGKNGQL